MKNNLIPQHFIDKLLKETDILSIIEEDIDGELKLDSNGEYVGYHKNKHGSSSKTSLRVNLNKFDYGVYHCFNCGEGGNVIKWLMLNRNMLFPEAVKYLAIKNKIEMPELDPEEQKKYEQYMQERIEIENIYNITARKYNEQLEEKHYAQLEKQWGIKRKTADDLQIGFAPAKDNFLYIELLELGCSVKILNKSGLFIKGHDFFQGRIVFPYWKEGNVVSFIARKTDQTPDNKYEQAKYKKLLTYSEKRPFVSKTVKNEYLYGIDTIKGQDYFIITEGITDAIMAHQSGLPCISPVTVKFRKDDKKKLEKIASRVKRIFIANDNEVNNTGSKGALASAKYLFKKGHQYVYIINIPKPDNMDKIDLAEYLKSHTKEDFEELMAKSKDPLTIGIKKVKDAPKDKKIEVAKDIYPLFKNLKPMVKETYFNDLHKAFKTLKIGKKVLRNAIQEAIEEENKKDKSYQENFKIGQDIIKSKTTGPISSLLEDEKGYYYINECYETDDIKPEYISNFKITVEEILIHPEEEVLSGYLTYNDGKKNEIIMTSEALVSNINFKKNIPSKAVWLGSEKDLQKLKINIYSKKPIKRKAVTVAGRHKDEIFLPGITIDKNGVNEDSDMALTDLGQGNFLSKLPSKWPDKELYEKASRGIFQHLPKINEPLTAGAVIAWSFSLPWAYLIRTKIGWGGFPHLIIFGEAGSGKTQTAKLIWRLNGISQDKEPFTLPNTNFTRMNNYSITNLIPVFMDEYRPEAWNDYEARKIHEELRNIYNGNASERGRANLTTKLYSLTAPIIICGEDRPRDTTGLEERIIVINSNKDIIDGASDLYGDICKDNFVALQDYPLEAFALPYWSWCLKQEKWEDILERARKKVIEFKDSKFLNVPERIINNLSILHFGWSMFKYYAYDQFGVIPEDLIEAEFDDVIEEIYYNLMPGGRHYNEFDQLIEFICTMINNGELEYRTHYSIKNQSLLILRLKQILPIAKAYANRTKRKKELLGVDAYYSIIRRLSENEFSYVISSSEKGMFNNNTNGGTTELRGVALDIDKLEETLGIEKEIWL